MTEAAALLLNNNFIDKNLFCDLNIVYFVTGRWREHHVNKPALKVYF